MFLQEIWLPDHESVKISDDFQDYNFLTTSADMFTATEDLILQSGPVWHGTALGWQKSIEKSITKFDVISDRFCGVRYNDANTNTSVIAYTAYLPTSGQDEEFFEILALLKCDIIQNNNENSVIIIGTDSNVSNKSTCRRKEAIKTFVDYFCLKTVLENEKATFHHNNQTSESQIDHILMFIPEKSEVKVNFKEHLCLKENPSNISSHDKAASTQ